MIVHLVLFTPRDDLAPDDRRALATAFEDAIRAVPGVRRIQVGQLTRHGAQYESRTQAAPQYAAMMEFDDLPALKEYLEHEAHRELGRRLWASVESASVYDYEVGGIEALATLV